MQSVSCPVVQEVFADPEPRVAVDVLFRVLLSIAADMHLEHPVEPAPLSNALDMEGGWWRLSLSPREAAR
jgi:hypothetical protein